MNCSLILEVAQICYSSFARPHVLLQLVSNAGNNGEDSICALQVSNESSHAKHKNKAHWIPVTVQNRKEKRSDTTIYSKRLNFKKSMHIRKKNDEYDAFGKFIAQELRALHSEVNRRVLKLMIQKAILKVSELDDGKQAAAERNLNSCSGSSENC
jgi:hypothetical protein